MKNIWPIALIAFFAVLITSLVSFAIWTGGHRDDLVSPTYYNEEINHQQRIDATALAKAEGLVPAIAYETQGRNVAVRFTKAPSVEKGCVTLYRPSEAALDRKIELKPDANGTQLIAANDLKAGLWRVKAEWTSSGKTYFAENSLMVP
jgi:nitrogen fixation protein FixH